MGMKEEDGMEQDAQETVCFGGQVSLGKLLLLDEA